THPDRAAGVRRRVPRLPAPVRSPLLHHEPARFEPLEAFEPVALGAVDLPAWQRRAGRTLDHQQRPCGGFYGAQRGRRTAVAVHAPRHLLRTRALAATFLGGTRDHAVADCRPVASLIAQLE